MKNKIYNKIDESFKSLMIDELVELLKIYVTYEKNNWLKNLQKESAFRELEIYLKRIDRILRQRHKILSFYNGIRKNEDL